MNLTVFAKKRTTKEGKAFNTYFSKLIKKDGEEVTTEVKFRDECGTTSEFPCNIVVNKENANFVEKAVKYTDKDGVEQDAIRKQLWVSAWTQGEAYVDHSLDDFAD